MTCQHQQWAKYDKHWQLKAQKSTPPRHSHRSYIWLCIVALLAMDLSLSARCSLVSPVLLLYPSVFDVSWHLFILWVSPASTHWIELYVASHHARHPCLPSWDDKLGNVLLQKVRHSYAWHIGLNTFWQMKHSAREVLNTANRNIWRINSWGGESGIIMCNHPTVICDSSSLTCYLCWANIWIWSG